MFKRSISKERLLLQLFTASIMGLISLSTYPAEEYREGGSSSTYGASETGLESEEPKANLDLLNAIKRDELDQIKFLLATGADPNTANVFGITALMMAVYKEHEGILKLLLNAGATPTLKALMPAIVTGNVKIVQGLLAAGADPGEELYGLTPLMQAASSNKEEILKELLARGASLPTAEQWNQLTPSEKALIKQYIPIVKQRRAVVSEWLEQKNLPTDLVRLVQKIGEKLPSAQTQAIYDDVEDVE